MEKKITRTIEITTATVLNKETKKVIGDINVFGDATMSQLRHEARKVTGNSDFSITDINTSETKRELSLADFVKYSKEVH